MKFRRRSFALRFSVTTFLMFVTAVCAVMYGVMVLHNWHQLRYLKQFDAGSRLTAVAISANQYVASGTSSGTVALFDAAHVRQWTCKHSAPILALKFTPDGNRLLSIDAVGNLRHYGLRSGTVSSSNRIAFPQGFLRHAAVSYDCRTFVALISDSYAVYDADKPFPVRSGGLGGHRVVFGISTTNDADYIGLGTDSCILIVDKNGKLQEFTDGGQFRAICNLNDTAFVAINDTGVFVLEFRDQQSVRFERLNENITAGVATFISYSPEAKVVALADQSGFAQTMYIRRLMAERF